MNGALMSYYWDIQGDVISHWTKGAKYISKFSADNTILAGMWRSAEEEKKKAGNTYDAIITRILGSYCFISSIRIQTLFSKIN